MTPMVEYYTPEREDLRRAATNTAGRVVARIALWLLALILAAILFVPLVWFAVILLVVWSHVMRRVRERRALAVFSYVEQAVCLNLPLLPWLDAVVRSESGAVRRRLTALGDALRDAVPVAAAIDATVPEADARQVAVLTAAEQTGALAPALRRLLVEQRDRSPVDVANVSFRVAYTTLVGAMIVAVTALLMVFVMPKFEQIFMDFNMRLPAATVLLLNVARAAGMPMVILAGLWILLLIGRAMERAFIGWRTRSMWQPLTDRLMWYLPVLRTGTRGRQYGDFCDAIAPSLEGGLPMRRAVHDASIVATNAVFRDVVGRWATAMDHGAAPAEGARQAGMPDVMIGLLATGTDGRNAADVFGFLARYYQGRFSRSQALLRAAAVPGIVLVFAAVVGLVAFGMFVPMVNLVDSVSLTTGF